MEHNREVEYRSIDFPPGYKVCSDGTVWTCKEMSWDGFIVWTFTDRWRQLTSWRCKFGHSYVNLFHEGKRRSVAIHRLVLEAFIGPCPPGMECCHNDGDPANNRLDNLRWDTHRANMDDAIRHGTYPKPRKRVKFKLSADKVIEIRRRLESGELQETLAREFDIGQPTVSAIKHRRVWKHV